MISLKLIYKIIMQVRIYFTLLNNFLCVPQCDFFFQPIAQAKEKLQSLKSYDGNLIWNVSLMLTSNAWCECISQDRRTHLQNGIKEHNEKKYCETASSNCMMGNCFCLLQLCLEMHRDHFLIIQSYPSFRITAFYEIEDAQVR